MTTGAIFLGCIDLAMDKMFCNKSLEKYRFHASTGSLAKVTEVAANKKKYSSPILEN
jgi:hypothetical protein